MDHEWTPNFEVGLFVRYTTQKKTGLKSSGRVLLNAHRIEI